MSSAAQGAQKLVSGEHAQGYTLAAAPLAAGCFSQRRSLRSAGSRACRLFHDFDNRVLHFLRHPLQLRRVEHRQKSGWLQSSQNGFAALLVNGDPAWQRGGDAHVFIEHFLRLLRLTDLEDQAFTGELDALLRHGLFEIVNLHNAKVIGLNGGRQSSRSAAHGFVGRYFDQHSFASWVKSSLPSSAEPSLNYFFDNLLMTTTSRTTTRMPTTVQTHIPPPAHPPIHPSVLFIIKSLSLRWDQIGRAHV